jgi:ParB family chromosome partitioning protein
MSRKERMAALDSAISSLDSTRRTAGGAIRSMVPIVNQIENVFQDSAAELDRLRSSGHILLELDPDELKTTRFSDRHAAAFSGATFDELVQDILRSGQLVPVLVRAAADGLGYEIIAGHRRVEACRRLGRKVLARRVAADDRELLVAMVRENESREDISPFERAQQIRSVIDGNLMSRQELMQALGFSKGHMSSLLKFAELPSDIVLALGDPRVLTIADGAQFARLMVMPEARRRLLQEANALAASADVPSERLRRLRAAAQEAAPSRRTSEHASERVIRSRTGQILVRLSEHDGRPILRLAAGIPPDLVNRVFDRLPELLRECGLDITVEGDAVEK